MIPPLERPLLPLDAVPVAVAPEDVAELGASVVGDGIWEVMVVVPVVERDSDVLVDKVEDGVAEVVGASVLDEGDEVVGITVEVDVITKTTVESAEVELMVSKIDERVGLDEAIVEDWAVEVGARDENALDDSADDDTGVDDASKKKVLEGSTELDGISEDAGAEDDASELKTSDDEDATGAELDAKDELKADDGAGEETASEEEGVESA